MDTSSKLRDLLSRGVIVKLLDIKKFPQDDIINHEGRYYCEFRCIAEKSNGVVNISDDDLDRLINNVNMLANYHYINNDKITFLCALKKIMHSGLPALDGLLAEEKQIIINKIDKVFTDPSLWEEFFHGTFIKEIYYLLFLRKEEDCEYKLSDVRECLGIVMSFMDGDDPWPYIYDRRRKDNPHPSGGENPIPTSEEIQEVNIISKPDILPEYPNLCQCDGCKSFGERT